MRQVVVGAIGLWLLWASGVHAYASLFEQLPKQNKWGGIIPAGTTRARVVDGPLIGVGRERRTVLDDGRLRIEQERTYARLKNPETGQVRKLPTPWRMRTRLLLSPSLRLLQADTRAWFSRSADQLFEDYKISEEREDLFEYDHIRLVTDASGKHITLTAWLNRKQRERERFEYPATAIPIEIATLCLGAAVHRHVERFDFDLLLPDGSTHGIRAKIHRVRDMSRFAEEYPLPRAKLRRKQEMAVVELRLASPIKYLLFPHRFYMVYESAQPGLLVALWGGEPGDHMQAFRIE